MSLGFTAKMARLGLWYTRRLLSIGEIRESEISRALSQRVDLYRMTRLYDGKGDPALGHVDPEWDRLTAQLAALIKQNTPDMEDAGLAILTGVLREDAQPYAPQGDRPFGCWTYELAWEGYADRGGWIGKLTNPARVMGRARKALRLPPAPKRNAALHFANIVAPASPFDQIEKVASDLGKLIADCRVRFPAVRELWCGTWLNSYPRFRALFPETWHRNGRVQPPGNFGNWWGQFQSRTGEFNHRLAAQFRATGEFPYPSLLGHAPLEEIDQHLKTVGTLR